MTPDPGLLEACWHGFVLGVVQGLTEFLPISSTAHLKVVPVLAGWGDPGVSLTAVIQLGSIVAVIAYFRADLTGVLKGTINKPAEKEEASLAQLRAEPSSENDPINPPAPDAQAAPAAPAAPVKAGPEAAIAAAI